MIAGLILAAGESTRMGRDKALLTYRGRTFLEGILSTLREAGIERIAVVLGHHAGEIQSAVNFQDAEIILNPQYRLGQTSSLQAGLRALERTDLEAVLLCLVDHPLVSVKTIRAAVRSFRPPFPSVVIPAYHGLRGHPVLFSRRLFPELLGLGPGEGANTVIRKHHESGRILVVEDPGVVTDIDDSKTYRRLKRA